jgi:hypothetical protein
MRTTPMRAFVSAGCALLLGPTLAWGGAGIQAGASLDPDQFVLGGVYYWEGNPIPSTDWTLPVVELGLGNEIVLLTAATGLNYRFPMRSKLGIYGGLEAGLNVAFVQDGDDDLEAGLMAVVGFDYPSVGDDRWGGEVKIDLANSPDFKFLVTYAFGPKSGTPKKSATSP